ncbi:GNAT family N-acetyltransferase [Streptomyces sp. NPDC006879]|uniref:GNAT family N-acetyltransferase n=1 Tax=Streptomyces sp. NPDC006879 TaxID=3364767 RepID=UPI0036CBEF2C
MIKGEKVALRARRAQDVPVLHGELYEDVELHSRASSRPWQPIDHASGSSPYAPAPATDAAACFSVVELATGELAGEAIVWGIDHHNRIAHLGLSLRPTFRGRGLGREVVELLCRYGFTVRGLNRLQVETLADNTAMITAAARCGFVLEGTVREGAWVYGAYVDEVVLGLLARDWTPTLEP